MTDVRRVEPQESSAARLGKYVRERREAAGLTLRQVEDGTDGRVKNGYLSQIEGGHIARPSPEILWQLARVLDVSYADLLARAGHRVPNETAPDLRRSINGVPLSALASLTPAERDDLVRYMSFLRHRRRGVADGS
jgi:transcriptional regulator with XRE-family HTH domain